MTLLRSLFSSSKKQDKSQNAQQQKDRDKDQNRSVQDPASSAGGAAEFAQAGSSLQRAIGNQALSRRAKGKQDSSAENAERIASQQATLDKERETLVPAIAETEYNRMVRDAIRKTTEYALLDKSTAAIREALKQKAVKAVTENIDRSEFSAEEKADAKQYAAEHVERQVIVPTTLHKYADHLVRRSISPRVQQKEIQHAALSAFREVKPNAALPAEKLVEDATNRAKRKAREEADRLSALLLRQNQEHLLTDAKGDMGNIAQFMNISEELGVSEAKKRHELDDHLVDDDTISNVYNHDLFEPLKKAVSNKLGVGRSFWQRQSRESKEFRKKLKEAGRAQAREDIAQQVDQSNNFSGETEKEFHKMIAGVHAYKLAKGAVDHAVEKEAGEIVEKVLPSSPTQEVLKLAAKSSAYSVARSNPRDQEAIKNKALQGARAKAAVLLKDAQAKAINEARKIYKGDKFGKASQPDVTKQGDLIMSVKKQVTQEDIAGKAIKQAIEAPNLNSGFAKISKVLDKIVPHAGDSASFEFELKIPIPTSPAGPPFVLAIIGFGGEVEKDVDEFTVGANLSLGAGFELFGGDVNLKMNFFMEAQSTDSVGAMNLISYGFYRQMRKISNKAADYFWSYGGKSGKSKTEEAELWAAMVEEKYMGDEGYVELGMGVSGGFEGGFGPLEAEVGAGIKYANRFDKDTIERLSPGSFGTTTDDKLKNIKHGSHRVTIEGDFSTELDVLGTSLGVEAEGSLTFAPAIKGRTGKQIAWSILWPREAELSASCSLPVVGGDATDWAKIVGKYALPLAGAVKSLITDLTKKAQKDANAQKAESDGVSTQTLGAFAGLVTMTKDFDNMTEQFTKLLNGDEVSGALSAASSAGEKLVELGLSKGLKATLNVGLEWGDDPTLLPVKNEFSIDVAQTKSLEIDAEYVSFEAEKSSRLFQIAYSSEEKEDENDNNKKKTQRELKLEFLGLRKNWNIGRNKNQRSGRP